MVEEPSPLDAKQFDHNFRFPHQYLDSITTYVNLQ